MTEFTKPNTVTKTRELLNFIRRADNTLEVKVTGDHITGYNIYVISEDKTAAIGCGKTRAAVNAALGMLLYWGTVPSTTQYPATTESELVDSLLVDSLTKADTKVAELTAEIEHLRAKNKWLDDIVSDQATSLDFMKACHDDVQLDNKILRDALTGMKSNLGNVGKWAADTLKYLDKLK